MPLIWEYLWAGIALKYEMQIDADLQYQTLFFRFLINKTPLNVYFILQYRLFYFFQMFIFQWMRYFIKYVRN